MRKKRPKNHQRQTIYAKTVPELTLSEELRIDLAETPQEGTIFKYVGKSTEIYRCPSIPTIARNNGIDSNGKFDYAALESFAGAKTDKIELLARFKKPDGTYQTNLPTPVIVQEDPAEAINNFYNDGGHGTRDKLAHIHSGGTPYIAIDTSVYYFIEPWESQADSWESIAPSGKWFTIGFSPDHWGRWNEL